MKIGSPHHNPQRHEAGFSMVQVMIALAVGVIVMLASNSVFTNSAKNAGNMRIKSDIGEIRGMILRNLNCADTIAAMNKTCKSGQPIDLMGKQTNRPILIGKPKADASGNVTGYTKIGIFSLIATCEDCNGRCPTDHKLVVKYAALDKNQGFVKDPLTGKLLDWQNGNDIFESIPLACEVPF